MRTFFLAVAVALTALTVEPAAAAKKTEVVMKVTTPAAPAKLTGKERRANFAAGAAAAGLSYEARCLAMFPDPRDRRRGRCFGGAGLHAQGR